jgi:hypothetical protein
VSSFLQLFKTNAIHNNDSIKIDVNCFFMILSIKFINNFLLKVCCKNKILFLIC